MKTLGMSRIKTLGTIAVFATLVLAFQNCGRPATASADARPQPAPAGPGFDSGELSKVGAELASLSETFDGLLWEGNLCPERATPDQVCTMEFVRAPLETGAHSLSIFADGRFEGRVGARTVRGRLVATGETTPDGTPVHVLDLETETAACGAGLACDDVEADAVLTLLRNTNRIVIADDDRTVTLVTARSNRLVLGF